MSGTLYLVATPIGNLGDFSFRAVETLKKCDYILCEDTRHSRHLFSNYQIDRPLKSYHKFNEARTEKTIIEDLSAGKIIGLVSDAGTPGISDPGGRLVALCKENNLNIQVIPGACAPIQALILSGFDTSRFQFLGFLPRQHSVLVAIIHEMSSYPGVSVCFESPHRLLDVLKLIHTLHPSLKLAIGRELTKKFEEILTGNAEELLRLFSEKSVKGEIVLLFDGRSSQTEKIWTDEEIIEQVKKLQHEAKLSLSDATKQIAEKCKLKKRDVYQLLHKIEKENEQSK